MREHGVPDHLLLIHEASAATGGKTAGALEDAADLVRHSIENYHKRLEEHHVFLRFEKAGSHVDLLRVLIENALAGVESSGVGAFPRRELIVGSLVASVPATTSVMRGAL